MRTRNTERPLLQVLEKSPRSPTPRSVRLWTQSIDHPKTSHYHSAVRRAAFLGAKQSLRTPRTSDGRSHRSRRPQAQQKMATYARIASPSSARSARATAASSTRRSSGRSAARRLARRPRRRVPAARRAATSASATATASRPVASVARVAPAGIRAPTASASRKDAPRSRGLGKCPPALEKTG